MVVQKSCRDSTHPDNTFKYSLGWFTRFKTRYKISLRRATNTAQKVPQDKEAAIQEFHRQIREVQAPSEGDGPQEEQFKLCQIANVDQTPLPFSFTDDPTYETINSGFGGGGGWRSISAPRNSQFLLMVNQE